MKNQYDWKLKDVYKRLYDADGKSEVILSAEEADELYDYLDYIMWLTHSHWCSDKKSKRIPDDQKSGLLSRLADLIRLI